VGNRLTTRTCTKCKQDLPITEFYKQASKNSGYKSHCKACVRQQRKEYYATPEGYKYAIEKAWRDKGMVFTVEEYDAMLQEQELGCAICGAESNKNGTRLCVDHCHTTGKIRGILCNDCNTTLGKFNDDVELLQNAIDYLNRTSEA
jgi:hypothetical protein